MSSITTIKQAAVRRWSDNDNPIPFLFLLTERSEVNKKEEGEYPKSKQKNKKPMIPKTETYKGKELLVLNPESKWPFKFGATKAALILENVDHIKSYVEEHGEGGGE